MSVKPGKSPDWSMYWKLQQIPLFRTRHEIQVTFTDLSLVLWLLHFLRTSGHPVFKFQYTSDSVETQGNVKFKPHWMIYLFHTWCCRTAYVAKIQAFIHGWLDKGTGLQCTRAASIVRGARLRPTARTSTTRPLRMLTVNAYKTCINITCQKYVYTSDKL